MLSFILVSDCSNAGQTTNNLGDNGDKVTPIAYDEVSNPDGDKPILCTASEFQ